MRYSYLLLVCVGCGAEPALPPPPPPLATIPLGRVDLGPAGAGHPDLGSLAVLSRGPRRMSVEQLERSLEQIGQLPPGSVVLPDSLAMTLGKPDYLRQTEESLDPSPLFMKFMLDLGAIVCGNFAQADPSRPVADRVLTRYEADVDRNLDYILLRFTGIEGPAAAPYRERLRRTYQRGALSPRGAIAGWEAVCIAVFTSPEMLLY